MEHLDQKLRNDYGWKGRKLDLNGLSFPITEKFWSKRVLRTVNLK
jgi:hypothetical protein